ncbi:hypothetical protein [Nitrosomonas sp. Nm33]
MQRRKSPPQGWSRPRLKRASSGGRRARWGVEFHDLVKIYFKDSRQYLCAVKQAFFDSLAFRKRFFNIDKLHSKAGGNCRIERIHFNFTLVCFSIADNVSF